MHIRKKHGAEKAPKRKAPDVISSQTRGAFTSGGVGGRVCGEAKLLPLPAQVRAMPCGGARQRVEWDVPVLIPLPAQLVSHLRIPPSSPATT